MASTNNQMSKEDAAQPSRDESIETLRAAQGDGQPCVVGRELDALVAERVMNIVPIRIPFVPKDVLVTETFTDDAAEQWRQAYPYSIVVRTVPRYSAEIAAAMEVENKIAELGLQTRYVLELGKIVDPRESRSEKVALLWWALVHATAEQRCRAALAAVAHKKT